MNILKTCTDISRKGIWNKNIQSKIPSISGANKTNQTEDLKTYTRKQFSTIAKTSNGKFPMIQVCKNLKTIPATRYLHIKFDPADIARSITVTEEVTLQKLGFADKKEAASLSNDEVVKQINDKLIQIFGVKSKEEIGTMEGKDILAKLDSVFKVREDNQPHVDYPAWLLPMLELPDLKMWEVSRQAFMDRSPGKGWIVFKGYFDTLNRLKKEGDI